MTRVTAELAQHQRGLYRPLLDRRQVEFGESVVTDQLIVGGRKGKKRSALGGRQPVHAVHHHRVALAREGQQPFQFRTLPVLTRSLVGKEPIVKD